MKSRKQTKYDYVLQKQNETSRNIPIRLTVLL